MIPSDRRRELEAMERDALVERVLELEDEVRRSGPGTAGPRYDEIFQRAPFAGALLEPDGTVVHANRALEELVGYTARQLATMSFVEFTHPDDVEKDWTQFRDLAEGRLDEYHMEKRYLHAEGRLVWGRLAVAAIRRSDGSLQHIVGMVEDITEEKRIRTELEELADDLRRSNEELQQFAYVASHDLQEPLRMVTSYLQLVERRYSDRLDDSGREFIAFAVDGATRMRALINGLLELSRIGTHGAVPAPLDAGEVLGEVLHDLEESIRESGATVDVGPLPVVAADRTQLAQLLANLLGNALKFRGDSPARIEVTAGAADRGMVRFAVRDHGIGVEPGHADRVFGIFERLHPRDRYPGTGIGLAVCRRIVERHGGAIGVEPAAGGGSTFWFTLPAAGGDEGTP